MRRHDAPDLPASLRSTIDRGTSQSKALIVGEYNQGVCGRCSSQRSQQGPGSIAQTASESCWTRGVKYGAERICWTGGKDLLEPGLHAGRQVSQQSLSKRLV